ncbi:hypothetical protein A3A36_02210 [Candidatus Kaiserbacteria bacterium RIFCSPLOWO2_01_FULL_52_12b]|uniref:Uncharacterized protein n=1 Tax=Candidatus Kaiserbacteria bacterium RIFCSPLOWO2_01_FULL_52_12b TaxID=1798509 RepID=A0A1F6EWF8_9BACT|nr:MAG: hypothetical protein A3A36_02210 [Candidatus Kaiserbacteria bacterium RIFCSPLOWO2_01_FULL_52_12b]
MDKVRVEQCLNKLDGLAKRIKEGPPLGLALSPTASRGRGAQMESFLKELREALEAGPEETKAPASPTSDYAI